MAAARRLRLVALGMMGHSPWGGPTWACLNWLRGLHRLGHEVWYVEDDATWPYDPEQRTATIVCSGYRTANSPASVLLRSSNLTASPVVFGDGLRCVDVPVVRMGAVLAQGGSSVHTFGHGLGPGAFHYQAWYRDQPGEFCTPDAFNLSSGLSLQWP